jgi:hypothetical protein
MIKGSCQMMNVTTLRRATMARLTTIVIWMLLMGTVLVLSGPLGTTPVFSQGSKPKAFASPKAAITALIDAAKKKDSATMLAILGSETKQWITSGDPVQDRQGREAFIAAFDQKNEIEKVGDTKAIMVIGDDGFPFPFPVIKSAKGWAFDPEQGREELFNRRIGRNELTTIKVLLAVGDAQREYASVDRNSDGVLEYAAKLRSSDGKQDGLYWSAAEGEPLSPLGLLVAEAVQEGYSAKKPDPNSEKSRAFHGYHFKLLMGQGEDAPSGEQDYIVGGKVIGGFAILAYPARYGNSGVETFMVSHDGTVYDADLGPDTAEDVQDIDLFNPGKGWEKVKTE